MDSNQPTEALIIGNQKGKGPQRHHSEASQALSAQRLGPCDIPELRAGGKELRGELRRRLAYRTPPKTQIKHTQKPNAPKHRGEKCAVCFLCFVLFFVVALDTPEIAFLPLLAAFHPVRGGSGMGAEVDVVSRGGPVRGVGGGGAEGGRRQGVGACGGTRRKALKTHQHKTPHKPTTKACKTQTIKTMKQKHCVRVSYSLDH